MTDYRARVDAEVTFTNGGGLTVSGFVVDVASAAVTPDEIAELLLASLGLLMAGPVTVTAVEIIEQPHKGTRRGPSDGSAAGTEPGPSRLVELSHVITAGLVTYPGLPAPRITPFLSREDSRGRYAEGTEFAMDCIELIGNTGTYLDSPYHRYAGGTDLAGLDLAALADRPAVVVRVTDSTRRGIDQPALGGLGGLGSVAGAAVLLHTGDAARFGTPAYADDAGFLTADGARWLVEQGVALVGIDSVNIDAIEDLARPAHSILLGAGIPIVEHLTGLEQLPPFGATFTAVPPRVADFGTFPVRAFARIPN